MAQATVQDPRDQDTQDRVLLCLERNRGRFHQVAELALDLHTSEAEVEDALKVLKKQRKVQEGTWGDGYPVFEATTQRRAQQERTEAL